MSALNHITLRGEIAPDQQLTYLHLPFEVPSGIQRLDVRYQYDSQISSDPTLNNGNTIDIGIFDTRGIGFSSEGFRGWTGSAHQVFSLGIDDATPGYMPGPIQAGTWHICLGAYKVAAGGCRYRVDISLTPTAKTSADQPVPTVQFPALLRLSDQPGSAPRPRGWVRGELHCHTLHSDGDSLPEEIVRQAEALGLDFLAVTDHNNRTQQIDLARIETSLMLIPGYEITTYYGHANVWGDGDWVDFRVTSEADMADVLAQAKANGYLVSVNHPRPFGPDWTFTDVEGYECVEIWNGPWRFLNQSCVSFWESRLAQGKRLTALGGSDHHFSKREHPARLGMPTTWIFCDSQPTPKKLLDAIRAGRTMISRAPDSASMDIRINGAIVGDTLTPQAAREAYVTIETNAAAGLILMLIGSEQILFQREITSDRERIVLTLDLSSVGYVRGQLVESSPDAEVHALTSAIYVSEPLVSPRK